MSAMNTLALPGRSEFFARFGDLSDLLEHMEWAASHQLPIRMIGGGSNVLMPAQVNGLVLQSAMTAVTVRTCTQETLTVAVDAGMNWHDWVLNSTTFGHGLENLALIPGTVGAAPVQNIGAYGVEVAELIEQVEGFQISTRQWRILSRQACRFDYRDSIFRHELANDFIVVRVVFALKRQFSPNLSYAPLAQWAAEQACAAGRMTPENLIAAVCAIRQSRLPDPAQLPNAGSFFKNPLVSTAVADGLKSRYPDLPVYSARLPQQRKLAAGWLVDQCGWRGKSLGPVRMHQQQALVLTAPETATLVQVQALQQAVVDSVWRRFGVRLEPEPQIFGA
ncbi:UDP-N-acetylmuramate dehydrogenase [Oceanobacter sp. 3_MG-2023]|uniref:UDP-N-acetylmuramate dehydrogenase n=1 Tax=Oceanobacter sp. 3_MG-2023 TaxID=3062622 RepID=UPI002735C7F2|nr:UDP-N-acetylmuramate dehydrogenase [Oceanobacter sp. 3_MG-2023]MDP2504254.1 UDP-N-acetylmuramate dehydrogenase [Oceanobacter sp. 3_MG-2023]